ncbi:MAG: hypothetical protein A2087_00075 [Spirochaetes bacterium GWD1_61_31]|nr:MAG: hypothetical protein A2Y37_06750 [Spirochaetes bacterium GWB1_60_80]OHD30774.1 MAG: hypothetical protein A2004_04275 [Spirochaetes bacterium GWC1_61_12]OHD42943.1 MAG: hypothetical protein A2087_00075 [Spirochaetes bacterium GWD1_61_31]OHD46273.1 MAG: hypothetical protein A2Y35_07025 [Spirochaetes bacterium GWE1_60_18]OHD60880.1 MAG: hypothetical protein A2Y32_11770 [Spirochaetes bacterium GWF1_60_12]HAP42862.1 hypothetical protein [Spirochaetaceae bacterium]
MPNTDQEISNSLQHYRTLGLSPQASAEQIKSRYRELALRHHPDMNAGSPESQAIFITIKNAWEILGNREKKKKYDAYLAARAAPPASTAAGSKESNAAPKRTQPTQASAGPRKQAQPLPGDMARRARQTMGTLLWDIDDLARQRSYGYLNHTDYCKLMFQILCCLYRWILRPAGFTETVLERLGLERLGAAALADMIYRYDASRLQFPLRSISDFWYLLRKPLERYLQRLDTLPWGATIPGATLSFIDAWIEAQNCITHYLGYIRRLENVYQTVLEPYVSALPGFEL